MSQIEIPGYILRDEIVTTVAALTGVKTKVTFHADDAYTDGKSYIVLPALASSRRYDVEAARVLRGYANHECAHITESDVPHLATFIRRNFPAALANAVLDPRTTAKGAARKTRPQVDERDYWRLKAFKGLENAIEDWRIEKRQAARFPGSHINIGHTRAHVNARENAHLQSPDAEFTMPNTLIAMITWIGAIDNAYPCAPLAAANLDLASQKLPEARAMLDVWWPRITTATNHRDVMAIAFDMANEAAKTFYDPQQRQQQPQPGPPQPQAGGNPDHSQVSDGQKSGSSGDPQDRPDKADKDSDSGPSDKDQAQRGDDDNGAPGPDENNDPSGDQKRAGDAPEESDGKKSEKQEPASTGNPDDPADKADKDSGGDSDHPQDGDTGDNGRSEADTDPTGDGGSSSADKQQSPQPDPADADSSSKGGAEGDDPSEDDDQPGSGDAPDDAPAPAQGGDSDGDQAPDEAGQAGEPAQQGDAQSAAPDAGAANKSSDDSPGSHNASSPKSGAPQSGGAPDQQETTDAHPNGDQADPTQQDSPDAQTKMGRAGGKGPAITIAIDTADDIVEITLDISDVAEQIATLTADTADDDDAGRIEVSTTRLSNPDQYRKFLNDSGASAARVAQSTRRLLMSEAVRRDRTHLEDGELDLDNIVGIATGRSDVYRMRDPKRARSAAIVFCLDHSGSMTEDRGRKMRRLAEASAAIASAIAGDRDIATAALTYTTAPSTYALTWIKTFAQPNSALKGAIGALLDDQQYGGTPSHFALLEAQKALFHRKEKRRIIFFITDGEAGDPGATLEAAQGIMRSKISLIGIGIGNKAPRMPIPGWFNITNPADLPIRLTEIVSDVLAHARAA